MIRNALRRAAPIATLMALVSFARAGVEEFAWKLPAGFPTPAVPADNPMSAAKVALGEALFSDPRLSITGKYSC